MVVGGYTCYILRESIMKYKNKSRTKDISHQWPTWLAHSLDQQVKFCFGRFWEVGMYLFPDVWKDRRTDVRMDVRITCVNIVITAGRHCGRSRGSIGFSYGQDWIEQAILTSYTLHMYVRDKCWYITHTMAQILYNQAWDICHWD